MLQQSFQQIYGFSHSEVIQRFILVDALNQWWMFGAMNIVGHRIYLNF